MTDYNLDDTQPRPPVQPPVEAGDTQPQRPVQPPPAEPVYQGPGCLVWSCVSIIGAGFAVLIVLLAGFAGWTTGQREAQALATATQAADIADQLNRIPAELAQGNLERANLRIRYLVTLTPGVEGINDLAATATAISFDTLPTATPTTEPTAAATEAADDNIELLVEADENGGYDLPALLAEAEADIDSGAYAAAYELLDVIAAVDESFEAQRVRQLTARALNGQARALFNTNRPAEAIVWASRAEEMGVLEGDLSFELFAAMRYLDATAAIGLSYPQAINALRDIVNLGPGRYYEEARQLLFDQYVGYADAYVAEGNHCAAVPQFTNALNILSSPAVEARRDSARDICERGTPVPAEGLTPGAPGQAVTPSGGVAPVGQPGA